MLRQACRTPDQLTKYHTALTVVSPGVTDSLQHKARVARIHPGAQDKPCRQGSGLTLGAPHLPAGCYEPGMSWDGVSKRLDDYHTAQCSIA